MKDNNQAQLKPRLFQVSIAGKIAGNSYNSYSSSLQLVTDDHDLEMSIEAMREDFAIVESVKTVELHIGYSAFCHDIFITGYNALQG